MDFLVNRLDVYIYDYLMKRKLHASAKAFQAEGKVSTDPVGRITEKKCNGGQIFIYSCLIHLFAT